MIFLLLSHCGFFALTRKPSLTTVWPTDILCEYSKLSVYSILALIMDKFRLPVVLSPERLSMRVRPTSFGRAVLIYL